MKIAFVIYNYSESKGGVERYAYDLARYLVREGHQIHVYCHQHFGAADKIAGVDFHSVPAPGVFPFLKYQSFAANSARMLREDEFDIIQGFGRTYYQDVYRVGSGCHWEYLKQRHPSMKNALGRLVQYLNPRNQIVMRLEKQSFAAGVNKKIVCISKRVKEEIQRYYQVPDEIIRVIYNGIDLQRFNTDNKRKFRTRTRSHLGFTDKDTVLLFVGSGFERKGLRYAIEGMAMTECGMRNAECGKKESEFRPSLKLLVIGKGNEGKYRAMAVKQGIGPQVIFLGAQSQIERYYAAGDIFLFPTLFEPFGTVCLEAMAGGLPVITSQIAGASEIIADGVDSFVVPEATDAKVISQRLEQLLDPARREAMGQAAAITAGKYSFENNFARMKEVYREVMK